MDHTKIEKIIENIEKGKFDQDKILFQLREHSLDLLENQRRQEDIQEVLIEIIHNNFTRKAKLKGKRDGLDALALTVNYCSEQMEEILLELEKKNKKLENAQHLSNIGSWELNLTTNELERSKEYCNIFEIDNVSNIASFHIDKQKIHPDDVQHVERLIEKAKELGTPFSQEYRLLTLNGEEKHIISRGDPIRDDNGIIIGIQGTVQDITENKITEKIIKDSLEEKNVLLKEIHHRVKNNLQVITSLLSLQAGFIDNDEIKGLFRYSQYRINSMAIIHEMLYQTENLSKINYNDYLSQLVLGLIESMKGSDNNITVQMNVENINLNIDTSIPLGLLINEIVTNSLKYGFKNTKEGILEFEIEKLKYPNFILRIGDNGIGFPDEINFRNTKSLGLKLIHKLALQLKGNIEKDNSEKGTHYIISFQEIEQTS